MHKKKIKRILFFWIDKLQITRLERITITVIFGVIVVLSVLRIVVSKSIVSSPTNHAQIVKEFQHRSALIEREQLIQSQKYDGIEAVEPKTETDEMVAPININSSSKADLIRLPGIGETYAQRIIEYRETNGDFTSVDDLVKVKGIGKRTLEKIKPFIKLN